MMPAFHCIVITEQDYFVVIFLPAAVTDTALRLVASGMPTPLSINGCSSVV